LAIPVVVFVLVLGFFGNFEDEDEEDAIIAEFSDRLSGVELFMGGGAAQGPVVPKVRPFCSDQIGSR
jgi:hypothetical protein